MNVVSKDEVYDEQEPIYSEDEYLAIEKNSQNKLEFRNGKIYSMAGGSFGHGAIAGNLYSAFKIHLRGKPCKSIKDTLKVKNKRGSKGNKFYYIPDVVVDCGQLTRRSEYVKEPIIIVEVLSPSTRNIDLFEKFHDYQQIKTLQEYVVVEQDSMCLIIYRREDNWAGERYIEGSDVEFKSIDLTLPIEEIYEDVEFEQIIRTHLVIRR